MTEPTDKWHDLLHRLAMGEVVDWDTQDINSQAEASIVEQLKSIEAIQRVFATQKAEPTTVKQRTEAKLFEWGHLHVVEKLGEGAYGEVYRAFDPILNRDVALKLLKPDQLATFHSKLFIEEAQRIARVRNRHVLAIHGAGVNQARAGFWSDLIVGNTLAGQVSMTLGDLLQVASSMSHALGAVHQAGLVHGDVKAANVMKDQNDQLVLMDFGAGLESGTEHASNHSIGSPMLMAPELFQQQPKSPATDMYALGCLLFYLASGQYPVKGENILDIVAAHQQQKYLKLLTLRPDLPASMSQLIQQLIAPQAADRPTAFEVNKRVEDIINEPARLKKRRLLLGIMGSLLVGMLLASTGLYFANVERQKAVLEQQKAQTVNDFLHEILGSSFNLGTGREVRVADMLALAATNAKNDFKDQPKILANLTTTLGQSFQNLQMMEQSQDQLLKSLSLHQTLYGDDHPDTLQVKLLLSRTEESMGNYQASGDLCQSVITQSQSKPQLKKTLQSAEVLCAIVKTSLAEYAEAEAVLSRLIAEAEQAAKPTNHLYLALMAQSQNHFNRSDFAAAVDAAQKAIETIRQVKNFKATNLLAANNQLAVALSSQGKYAEAEPIMVEQLELSEQYYGVNNMGYLQMLINLGANLQSQGKLTAAVKIQEQSVSLIESLKGSSDRMTLSSQMNLANTYVSLNRLEEGEQLMRDVLKVSTNVLGPDRMETFMLQYNLGELLNNTGRFNESLSLSQQSLPQMQTTLGDAHLVTLLTQDNMAVSFTGIQQHQQALAYFKTVLQGLESGFGQDNPYYLLVKGHQVDGLIQAGEIEQAAGMQQQLIEVQRRVLGETHEQVLQAEVKLKGLLTDLQNQ
ncbi:serine/threonine-protein kinase [Marinicella litoralis]|uniref:Serine/threonine protein kinase n=1 Tax=Marinicella litoralis TaxID=644220 RepID=A0A4R6XLQ5_9GAMM|nr:serine/threonine-protein kinase [Marinicella litoralis]TDR20565.1 serine/threonine protein kinase [Marinicella litoralis]